MNKLYRLCEYGISITTVKKIIEYSIDHIDIISNIKDTDRIKIKEIVESDEYKNASDISVFGLIEYGLTQYQVDTLHKKGITIEMIKNQDIKIFKIPPRLKNDLLRIKKQLFSEYLSDNKEIEIVNDFQIKEKFNKIYKLCEYNIPFSIVKSIIHYNIDELKNLEDFQMKDEIIKIIDSKEFIEDSSESVYELEKFGLSNDQIERLVKSKITINDIITKHIEEFDIPRSLKNELYPISRAIVIKYKDFSEDFYEKVLSDFIESYGNKKRFFLKDELYELMSQNNNYNTDFFEANLNKLIEYGYIVNNNDNLEYIYPRLWKKLNSITNDYEREIIKELLDGVPLSKIGEKMGYSSGDQISKIIKRKFAFINPTYEDIHYRELFQEYDWDKELFNKYWEEDDYVFEYLKFKYKKGTQNPYALYAKKETTDKQKCILDEYYGVVELYGEKIYLKRENLLKIILKNEAIKPVKIKNILDIFNKYADIFKIEKIKNEESFLRLFDIYDCFIRSDVDLIKYYNYYEVSMNAKLELKRILNSLMPGEYGIDYIYNKFINYFNSINLQTGREVHSFLKLINAEKFCDIVIAKYPYILIKISNKKDFFESILKKISPVNIEDAVAFFTEYYGHNSNSCKTYLFTEFNKYITNEEINYGVKFLEKENELLIRTELINDLYSLADVEEIFKKIIGDDYKEYLNTYNMSLIGYSLHGEYALKDDDYYLDDYILDVIKDMKIINKNDIPYNHSSFVHSALRKLEKQYDIIEIDDERYINFNVLKAGGITKEDIIEYGKQIEKEFAINEFFTMKNVRERIPAKTLDEEGFSERFYESIIYNVEDVRIIKFDFNNIYYLKKSDEVMKRSKDFVEYVIDCMIESKDCLEFTEILEYLEYEYGIVIKDDSKLKVLIKDSKYYYDDIFRRIYKSKDEYLDKIYS